MRNPPLIILVVVIWDGLTRGDSEATAKLLIKVIVQQYSSRCSIDDMKIATAAITTAFPVCTVGFKTKLCRRIGSCFRNPRSSAKRLVAAS